MPLRTLLLRYALVVALFAMVRPAVHAGSREDWKVGVELYGDEPIRQFALRVNDELDARQVNVGIIARSGRPRAELPSGISYTHVAFIVFEPVQGADGAIFHTYTVYNLYQGDADRLDRSYLKQDLTYDFVAGINERDVAICVPDERLQARLLEVIRSPAYRTLHNPDYNLVANPWVDRYDNCVTHTLKVVMAAIYQTDDRARIYGNIRSYFKPTPIRLGPLQTVGSTLMSDIRRDDRDRAGLQTASYDSLKRFLIDQGLVKDDFKVTLD